MCNPTLNGRSKKLRAAIWTCHRQRRCLCNCRLTTPGHSVALACMFIIRVCSVEFVGLWVACFSSRTLSQTSAWSKLLKRVVDSALLPSPRAPLYLLDGANLGDPRLSWDAWRRSLSMVDVRQTNPNVSPLLYLRDRGVRTTLKANTRFAWYFLSPPADPLARTDRAAPRSLTKRSSKARNPCHGSNGQRPSTLPCTPPIRSRQV